MKPKIYVAVDKNLPPEQQKCRLVKAKTPGAARVHVASGIHVELASQDTLVSLTMAGVKVEEAAASEADSKADAPT